MKSTSLLASFWLGAVVRGAASFASTNYLLHHTTIKQKRQQQLQTSLHIRGGGDSMSRISLSSVLGPAADAVGSALVSGTPLRAVGGMWAVSSLVIVPLTFIRQGYSFSVGYGFSVAAMVRLFCPFLVLGVAPPLYMGCSTGCADFATMKFPASFIILIFFISYHLKLLRH